MLNEHCIGQIADIREDGSVVIKATLPNLDKALLRRYKDVEIILPDGRRISPEQRRKIYALIGEVAEYVDGIKNSETIEEAKTMLKWQFLLDRLENQERRIFSLSDCDMTLAKEFITYLIDFIIAHDIPSSISLLEHCEDIGRYVYACAMNRKCAICGREADIHHITGSKIGMGNIREEVHHLGREVLPLCRLHHTECHQDEQKFMAKYHLEAIALDDALCRRLRLRG
jgi:hypothetical protein